MIVDINRWHRKAIEVVERERLLDIQKYRTVAFVLDSRGRFIGEGWNSYVQTHPVQKRAAEEVGLGYKEYLHAEVHALTRMSKAQLERAAGIVVLRLNANLELRMAKPCPICNHVIKEYGIEHVVHS